MERGGREGRRGHAGWRIDIMTDTRAGREQGEGKEGKKTTLGLDKQATVY